MVTAKEIEDELKRFYESGRRKEIERRNTGPVKATLEEVMKKVENLQVRLDAYTLELAENQKRIMKLLGGRDGQTKD